MKASHCVLSTGLKETLIKLSADRLPNLSCHTWLCNWEGIEWISDSHLNKVSVLISKKYKLEIDLTIESFLFLAISHWSSLDTCKKKIKGKSILSIKNVFQIYLFLIIIKMCNHIYINLMRVNYS